MDWMSDGRVKTSLGLNLRETHATRESAVVCKSCREEEKHWGFAKMWDFKKVVSPGAFQDIVEPM